MADPIAWGMIDEVGEKIDGVGPKIDNINKNVGAIAGDVENTLNTGMNTWTQSINKAVQDLKTETSEMHTIVRNAPSGLPAADMEEIGHTCTPQGISLDYKVAPYRKSENGETLATTAGVMVRYSETGFPKNIAEGMLAFDDKDVIAVDAGGAKTGKKKNALVSGLSLGTTYYFSFFPYTTHAAHNESLGPKNSYKAEHTMEKGRLRVNLKTDFDYKPLGTVTVTVTPASGQAMTKSGSGSILFEGIPQGACTVAYSAASGFTKPNNQSIRIVGGALVATAGTYVLEKNIANYSWDQIGDIAKDGNAKAFFNVGDTKELNLGGGILAMEIVGFDHDNLVDGGKAPITWGMQHLMAATRQMNSSNTNVGSFAGSQLYSWLGKEVMTLMPADIKKHIRPVIKKTSEGNNKANIIANQMSIFLFSEIEVFGKTTYSYTGEGTQYARFTTTSTRIKKLNNGSGSANWWWLRSPYSGSTSHFCNVNSGGSATDYSASNSGGVCFGFCF